MLKATLREILGEDIASYWLFPMGDCNDASIVETMDGKKSIIKMKKSVQSFVPQNSILVEAKVAQLLASLNLRLPVPRVTALSEKHNAYAYDYIPGVPLRTVWQKMTEERRIKICKCLGKFHAEIATKVTVDAARNCGVLINASTGLHPEVETAFHEIISNQTVPKGVRALALHAREMFDDTHAHVFFHFLHNDAHHENVLVDEEEIAGVIDFGESEYGEVAKEFSRYIRDFPAHFEHIVTAYERSSGNKLSRERLVSNAFLSGLPEIAKGFNGDDGERQHAKTVFQNYVRLFALISK